jgi:hypothetical protein
MKRVLFLFAVLFLPLPAAAGDIVDALSLAPFVPLVLDAMMTVAIAGYEFFVGNGGGIIYLLVWAWLAITICLYLVKLFLPSKWLEMFGLKGSDALAKGELTGFKMGEALLKPGIRALFAIAILLQVRPQYITNYIVDPFLQFGDIYTTGISEIVVQISPFGRPPVAECPPGLVGEDGYISARGCNFLVQPVATITHANGIMIRRGLQLLTQGLTGLVTSLIPRAGEVFLNIITGILLITTFVSSNFFMALLIIQGIFNFGMALILYPFKVLMYVAKPEDKEAWFDPWDAFSDLIPALKQLVITMIASMFIMAVNIAVLAALFRWNTSVFVQAADGAAHSNLPVADVGGIGFGQHMVTWLSAVLTLYLMFQIFEMTREQLKKYAASGPGKMEELHGKVMADSKTTWTNVKGLSGKTTSAVKWVRSKFWK